MSNPKGMPASHGGSKTLVKTPPATKGNQGHRVLSQGKEMKGVGKGGGGTLKHKC